jgi:hypothetical protein
VIVHALEAMDRPELSRYAQVPWPEHSTSETDDGHVMSGTIHTLDEQLPYRQSSPVVHDEPGRPALSDDRSKHRRLAAPTIPV